MEEEGKYTGVLQPAKADTQSCESSGERGLVDSGPQECRCKLAFESGLMRPVPSTAGQR